MTNTEITEFFDSVADSWDIRMVKSQQKINEILDVAEVSQGKTVLDIACGTGVLIPDYIFRNVKKCVAVDISSKMIEVAKNKFANSRNVQFVCADASDFAFGESFDSAVVYNAFPHFTNPEKLFENVAKHLKCGGRLTIAHGMSREDILKHHSGSAKNVSVPLPEATELAEIMKLWFAVDTAVSTDKIYIVSGLVI